MTVDQYENVPATDRERFIIMESPERGEILEPLTKRIGDRLTTAKFCTVYETELERMWPVDSAVREERAALIRAYAKENGWSASVTDPGMRVTFRKLSETTKGNADVTFAVNLPSGVLL